MANPQAENGHLDLSLEIVEKFCSYRIRGEEWLVLWAILRKTYGWHKKTDRISFSQFSKITGLKRPTVSRAVSGLLSKKIISVIKNDNSGINLYSFNKDFDDWMPLSKKITVLSKMIRPVIKNDNRVLSKMIHTKENITKETITKEILPSSFDIFWSSYPKKIGKKDAEKSWLKSKDKPTIEIILKAIENQKKSEQWNKDGGQYIPNPSTWINQGRWDDEPKIKTGHKTLRQIVQEECP